MDDYMKSYQQLVANVADALRPADVEKLDWFYKESLSNRRPPAQADAPWTALSVLRALEEADVFSHERPDSLATVMLEVKREDQQKAVKNFVEKYRETLSSIRKTVPRGLKDEKDGPFPPRLWVKQGVAVVPTTYSEDLEDEEEGDYMTFIPPSRPLKQGPATVPPNDSSSSSKADHQRSFSDEEEDKEYSYAYPCNRELFLITDEPAIVSPESSLSSASSPTYVSLPSSDGKAGGGNSSDDDDYSYAYQSTWLKTLASGQRLTLTQKLKLRTPPLQSMIHKQETCTIPSNPIRWQLLSSQLVFKLHIDPMGCHSGIAATLYLQKEPKLSIAGILTAELTVHQKPSVTTSKKSSQLKLFQCSIVMDMPDKNTPSHYPLAVARFPMILSHRNLLNNSIIHCRTLDISVTLRHSNSQ